MLPEPKIVRKTGKVSSKPRSSVLRKKFRYPLPVIAIRDFCVECNGDSAKAVRECTASNCPLFPYRMGRHPSEQDLRVAILDWTGDNVIEWVPYKGYRKKHIDW